MNTYPIQIEYNIVFKVNTEILIILILYQYIPLRSVVSIFSYSSSAQSSIRLNTEIQSAIAD